MRPIRPACTTFVALVAGLALAACGDDSEDGGGGQSSEQKTVAFEISGSGKSPKMTAPKSVEGGVVTVELSNKAKDGHGLQLGYVDEGHTPQEGLEAAAAWGEKGRPLPAWVHLQGGVGTIAPGGKGSATQELPEGRYFAVDIDSNASAFFRVSGGGGGEEPSAPAKIEASEYKFTASGLKTGKTEVLVDNVGEEPHFVAAIRIKPGKTIADVRKFIRTEKGEPPIVEADSFDTAIIDGGVKQTVEVEPKKSGKYALLCFVADRKGGPPHVAKGMISEADVR